MYARIKALAFNILPKEKLFNNEYRLRYFHYLLYTGNKYQCNMCRKKLRKFIDSNHHRICPRCGSIERNRRLWQLLQQSYLSSARNVLDFSPSRSLHRLMKKEAFNYVSSDLSGDFIATVSYDITNIDSVNATYDLIICYHILEHIVQDKKAISELFRVLKNGGTCLIQTPFKSGSSYEDASITSPAERLIHFGQSDHVRIYAIKDLKQRLETGGFTVKVAHFTAQEDNLHGFNIHETVLICTKT